MVTLQIINDTKSNWMLVFGCKGKVVPGGKKFADKSDLSIKMLKVKVKLINQQSQPIYDVECWIRPRN